MINNTSLLTINLSAIASNLKLVKSLAAESKVMAVLKANAYGHGLVKTAKHIEHAIGGIAVARLQEAMELRENGITCPLLLLGTLLDNDTLNYCAHNDIAVVAHTNENVELILQASLASPVSVWLKLDTGMHRLGVAEESAVALYQSLKKCEWVSDIITMTHLSDAESEDTAPTARQLDDFDTIFSNISAPQSIANSAGILYHPTSHRDWVRPGIMLFGANPRQTSSKADTITDKLKPTMTLSAKIIAIRDVKQGESVGYNGTWIAPRPSKIATLGIGYADGYPRHANNGTPVLVNGQRVPIAGRVSMDLITVDITECKGVAIGDEAILWGEGLLANEVAIHCDTIAYELFTSVTNRVTRQYI